MWHKIKNSIKIFSKIYILHFSNNVKNIYWPSLFFFFWIILKSFIQTRPDNRGQSASQTEVKSLILIETKGRVGVQSKFCCDMGSRIARSLNPRERAKLKLWDQGGYIVVYSHPCIWIIHTHTNICIYTKLFYSIQN